jgi:recyclin-1
MFEINMDEYLDDEVEAVKVAFDAICREWDKKVRTLPTNPHIPH